MVDIAIARYRKKEQQTFTYDTNVLALQSSPANNTKGGSKGTK